MWCIQALPYIFPGAILLSLLLAWWFGVFTKETPKDGLIDAFIWSIRHRPDDYKRDAYKLMDRRSGLEWWIANDEYGFQLDRLGGGIRFTSRQRRRAWRAVTEYLQDEADEVVEKAWDRMVEANDAALAGVPCPR